MWTVSRRSLAGLALAGVGGVVAGCDSDQPRDSPVEPVVPPQVTLQSKLTEPAHLRGRYVFARRRRRVDAQIAFDNLLDPYRDSILARVPGTRMVAVQMKVLNRGPDAFPLEWARFRGYDDRGGKLPLGGGGTPVRKTLPGQPVRGQVLTSVTAFRVPRGRQLAAIRMSSIVNLWRFQARWTLER